MKKRVAELFAGVGGFRIGLEKLNTGWNFVYANQWEPGKKVQYAFDCYVRHYGLNKQITNIDINKVTKSSIPDIELLVGGFPCQDYSVARSKAQGIVGKKGVLWWDIRDTIEAKSPPFILLENVDRLLSSPGKKQRGRDFGMILYTLYQLGYGVQWRVINAADYGFPQRRRRVFIFAYRKSTNYYNELLKIDSAESDEYKAMNKLITQKSVYNYTNSLPIKTTLTRQNTNVIDNYIDAKDFSDNFSFHFQSTGILVDNKIYTASYVPDYNGKKAVLNDILEDNVTDESLFLDSREGRLEKFQYLKGAKKIPRIDSNGFAYNYSEGGMAFPDPLDRPARTMLTSEHSTNRSTHVVSDKATGRLRLITPLEAERIQTFPDNWTDGMPNSARYFVMGNALVCDLISKIGEGVDEILKKE
ncbi:DNA (cytosine-5-)-methyltransferase [Liquorilactobacillus mali]|uniref:DNA (cytosine-5-)-methyltransferase n=1 Tax=Liquorilactobacillus mali TaxID=1618 RepID=UPI0039E7615A